MTAPLHGRLPDDAEPDITSRRCGVVLASTNSVTDVEGVLNPGVARDRRGTLLLYPRIVAAGNVSRVGVVRAVETHHGPLFGSVAIVLAPEAEYEHRATAGGYGCEDPRVTFIPRLDAYVMAYAAFGPAGPRIALAASQDGYAWQRLGLVRFADEALNDLPNKDAAFFPEPVMSPAGVPSLALYHRPMLRESVNGQAPIGFLRSLPPERREVTQLAYVALDRVLQDLGHLCFAAESVTVLPVGDTWGVLKNGAGTPPVRTSAGWMSVFHAVDAVDRPGGPSLYYRAGIVVHDLHRPDRIVYRSPHPILAPDTVEERYGTVDDVVFPTGIDARGDGAYDVYYGAADAKISRMRMQVSI